MTKYGVHIYIRKRQKIYNLGDETLVTYHFRPDEDLNAIQLP